MARTGGGGGVGYELGASTIVAGDSNTRGAAGQSQLESGCGYSSGGVQGRQATIGLYVEGIGTYYQWWWGFEGGGLVDVLCKAILGVVSVVNRRIEV